MQIELAYELSGKVAVTRVYRSTCNTKTNLFRTPQAVISRLIKSRMPIAHEKIDHLLCCRKVMDTSSIGIWCAERRCTLLFEIGSINS